MKNITIVGAGNMGLAMVAYMTVHRKVNATLFTNKRIDNLRLNDVEKQEFTDADGFTVTGDPETAFCNADIIFVTYPAFLRKNSLKRIKNTLRLVHMLDSCRVTAGQSMLAQN